MSGGQPCPFEGHSMFCTCVYCEIRIIL